MPKGKVRGFVHLAMSKGGDRDRGLGLDQSDRGRAGDGTIRLAELLEQGSAASSPQCHSPFDTKSLYNQLVGCFHLQTTN
jgi:hypothetical protein